MSSHPSAAAHRKESARERNWQQSAGTGARSTCSRHRVLAGRDRRRQHSEKRSHNQAFLNLSVGCSELALILERPLRHERQGKHCFSVEGLARCSLENNNFSNDVRLLIPSESQEGSRKNRAVEGGLAFNVKAISIHLQDRHTLKKNIHRWHGGTYSLRENFYS